MHRVGTHERRPSDPLDERLVGREIVDVVKPSSYKKLERVHASPDPVDIVTTGVHPGGELDRTNAVSDPLVLLRRLEEVMAD